MSFNKEEFSRFLIDNNVVGFKEQDITLKSGRISRWYANCRALTNHTGIADKTANFIIDFIQEKGVEFDYVYGIPAGATKLATLINYKIAARQNKTDMPLVIGREKPKEHGEPKDRFFIGPVKAGDKVVAVEDVTTTGGSLISGIERLKEAGINVVAAVGLVNRMEKRDDGFLVEEKLRQMGITHYSMADAFDLLPMEFKRNSPSPETMQHVENYFRQYSIREINFGNSSSSPVQSTNPGKREKIFVALDVDSSEKALKLADELKDYVGGYKIGKQLFTSAGPDLVRSISAHSKVFLDLKYHDIPNTVAGAAREATKLGVYMFNIHASGGYEMMKAAADAVKQTSEELGIQKPIVLGVTVLTSINQEKMNTELKVSGAVEEQVVHLARLAKQAGLDGVVASAKETRLIKEACGSDFLVVTPGIRPLWAASGDQKRVVTPSDALADGSDYLVIGRAITGQPEKIEAAKKIVQEIGG